MNDDQFLREFRHRTLEEHINLGERRAVSYLPLKTIEEVLCLTIEEYRRCVEAAGSQCVVLSEDETCIRSGAVYAYSAVHLSSMLQRYSTLVSAANWPTSPEEFVRKMAQRWCEESEPIMLVIRAAFGDLDGHGHS